MQDDIGVLNKLPDELAYLVGPAVKYGVHQFDGDVDRFLDHATDDEISELAGIAEKVRLDNHYEPVCNWLDRFEIDEYEEAANLYFLFGVMDAAGFGFD